MAKIQVLPIVTVLDPTPCVFTLLMCNSIHDIYMLGRCNPSAQLFADSAHSADV